MTLRLRMVVRSPKIAGPIVNLEPDRTCDPNGHTQRRRERGKHEVLRDRQPTRAESSSTGPGHGRGPCWPRSWADARATRLASRRLDNNPSTLRNLPKRSRFELGFFGMQRGFRSALSGGRCRCLGGSASSSIRQRSENRRLRRFRLASARSRSSAVSSSRCFALQTLRWLSEGAILF